MIDKQCGLAVSSLSDLEENLDILSEEQYKEMLNAKLRQRVFEGLHYQN